MKYPIAITGVGMCAPRGRDTRTVWAEIRNDVGPKPERVGPWDVLRAPVEALGEGDRSLDLAVQAAREAGESARWSRGEERTTDCTFSSSKGGVGRLLESKGDFLESFFPHAANGRVRKTLGLGGDALSLAAACATGSASLVFAAQRILRGECPSCVAGATESALVPLVVSGFGAMGLLTSRWGGAAPFDRTRDGFMMGEGAAALVLEESVSAHDRGARVMAYLSGWALGCDPSSPIDLSEDGSSVESVVRAALSRAGLHPREVGYVNAHGTGTRLNDRVECAALRRVFEAPGPWVSSTKSATGHLLGAAAAVEAVLCVRILETGWAPPTRGLRDPDPDCVVRHVPPAGVEGPFRHVLSLNYGLGGHVAALVLSRAE